MNNISIRHIRAFLAVARDGSFTRAAESLHLTQSTLTGTIKQLEEQAGLTLFDRTTRQVLLSGEGERFLPVAERLLSDFDTAMTDLRAVAEGAALLRQGADFAVLEMAGMGGEFEARRDLRIALTGAPMAAAISP